MALFGNKSKEDKIAPCCCSSQNDAEVSYGEINSIMVLGADCKSSHEQYKNVKKAVAELVIDVEMEYITDMEKVMTNDAMSMPAIVVNDKIASAGLVMKMSNVIKLLRQFATQVNMLIVLIQSKMNGCAKFSATFFQI